MKIMKRTTKRTLRLLVILGLIAALLMGSVTAFAAGSISKDKAKSIALKKAGVKSTAVTKWIKVKLDNWDDDGDKEWDVEFKTKSTKYEVEINAKTGKVEEFEKEKIQTKISKDKAKSVALKKAGVKSSAVKKWVKVKLDGDEWDVEFKTAKYKFEVEINAKTGKIKDFEKKKLATDSASISKDKAKSIALNHAKGKATIKGSVKYTKAKLDREGGRLVYEIEFKYKRTEFEYEIDASTGVILDWDMDRDD